MKPTKVIVLIVFAALALTACRKDNIEQGPFAIEAKDYLSSKKYEKLLVEICYVDGFAPEQASIDHLKAFMQARCNKPGGISFNYTSITSPGKGSYDIADLEELEKDHRVEHSRRDQLVVFVFFADAGYSSANILGVAHGTTSCAVFEKPVKDNSGGIGQPSQFVLEATVLEHEFGHLLGLVDNGTDMVSAHSANEHHCNNEDCLMYYAVETLDFIGNLAGGEIPELDANCIADLQANGGK
jgi:hypothetical protein